VRHPLGGEGCVATSELVEQGLNLLDVPDTEPIAIVLIGGEFGRLGILAGWHAQAQGSALLCIIGDTVVISKGVGA
jgi:hypothetical protein